MSRDYNRREYLKTGGALAAVGLAGCAAPHSGLDETQLSDNEFIVRPGDNVISRQLNTIEQETQFIDLGDEESLPYENGPARVAAIYHDGESAQIEFDGERIDMTEGDRLDELMSELVYVPDTEDRSNTRLGAALRSYNKGGMEQLDYQVEAIGDGHLTLESPSGEEDTLFERDTIQGDTDVTDQYEILRAEPGQAVLRDTEAIEVETFEEGERARNFGSIGQILDNSVERTLSENLYFTGEDVLCRSRDQLATYVGETRPDAGEVDLVYADVSNCRHI